MCNYALSFYVLPVCSLSNTSNDEDSDQTVIAVFTTLFVIAVLINILLAAVIVFLVTKLKKASYSPDW